jgi:hypothetical protein
MKPEYRLFVAHAKDVEDLEALRARVYGLADEVIGDQRTIRVVMGFEDWQTNFSTCGSWDSWAQQVGAGRLYGSPEPRYHAIVVPDEVVGRATEQVVRAALAVGTRVLRLDAAGFHRVARIDSLTQDYRTSGRLIDAGTAGDGQG